MNPLHLCANAIVHAVFCQNQFRKSQCDGDRRFQLVRGIGKKVALFLCNVPRVGHVGHNYDLRNLPRQCVVGNGAQGDHQLAFAITVFKASAARILVDPTAERVVMNQTEQPHANILFFIPAEQLQCAAVCKHNAKSRIQCDNALRNDIQHRCQFLTLGNLRLHHGVGLFVQLVDFPDHRVVFRFATVGDDRLVFAVLQSPQTFRNALDAFGKTF